ncbi:hypothetical protein HN803_06455 [candidate division WWE3 bacterium]|jgi:tRNA dimethylallyltransferase|nr:hypothetical protein [candidate division WWE3 bacterium]MBT7350398.1 hypothetical protein [candidate division WWE3 bacterium]
MDSVYVILGPTSSGKTSLALELCKKFDGAVVSADSRQIIKGMDIGTGKVPLNSTYEIQNHVNYWTFDGVPVWGYDLATPGEFYSAYDYASWALPKISELLEEGKNVFLVGGTGFFIDFVTGRVTPSNVPPNFKLRKELETLELPELQEKMMSLNLDAFNKVDQNNPARLIRAIEVEVSEKKSPTPLPYLTDINFKFLGLSGSREVLYARSDSWLDMVWDNGLVEETKKLIANGFEETKSLNGLIYKSVRGFLNEEITEEEARYQAKSDIHAYIRRQQTYFKKIPDVKWFDISDPTFAEQIEHHVQS